VDDAASTAVLAVGQTYADALARGATDGKITKAEAEEAKRRALEEAKRQLGPDGWEKWCELLGNENKAEEGLSARVEAALKKAKTRLTLVK
jgi:trans-2-enoyl-CoA reductase